MYKKLRNFRTVPPGITNLVSKCAGDLKEKSPKVSWRELCALQSNHTKCRRGGGGPSLFRVKTLIPLGYFEDLSPLGGGGCFGPPPPQISATNGPIDLKIGTVVKQVK